LPNPASTNSELEKKTKILVLPENYYPFPQGGETTRSGKNGIGRTDGTAPGTGTNFDDKPALKFQG